MSDLRQLPPDDDYGTTQPVAHLALSPTDLERRFGIRFTRDRDDFDELVFAVVELADHRLLLSRDVSNPKPGTTVAGFDAGDPMRQAATLAPVAEHRQRRHRGLGRQPVAARSTAGDCSVNDSPANTQRTLCGPLSATDVHARSCGLTDA